MAASKPTSWLSPGPHFVRLTQAELRGLRRRSGFFSSRARTLAPAPLLHRCGARAFGVRQVAIGGEALLTYRSLYLSCGSRHAAPKCLSGSTSYPLLHTPHPEAFQRLSVRTSIPCYRDFILDMCRSPGFASANTDSTASSASLSLRLTRLMTLNLAGDGNS